MNKLTIARIIAVVSAAVGIMVIIGWLLDITILTSILPEWIRMKFATASCFIFSGAIVFLMTLKEDTAKLTRQVSLTFFSGFLILVMGLLFLGSIFGFQTGMENIRFIDIHEIQTPIFQGRPSLATMISFMLIAILGLWFNFNSPSKKVFSITGTIVGIIGAVGVLGYLTSAPMLYYEIPGLSNAIAIHTTLLFSLLGLAIVLIGQTHDA